MNKLLTLAIAGLLTLTMTGCSAATTETVDIPTTDISKEIPDDNTSTRNETDENRTEDGYYISPTDDLAVGEVITVGDIMQFDGKYIHIISGDLVEVFEYDNVNEKDFYIGQTVQLLKGDKENTLEIFEREDYAISHTNMGQMIDQITGTLEKLSDEMITLKTDGESVLIKTYNPIDGQVGDKVTIYTIKYGSEDSTPSAIMTLNENSKLSLTISSITRSDEGIMNLILKDSKDGEYAISASHVSMELDMAKLEVGDELTVYYKGGIMESWPMQLDTVLIR